MNFWLEGQFWLSITQTVYVNLLALRRSKLDDFHNDIHRASMKTIEIIKRSRNNTDIFIRRRKKDEAEIRQNLCNFYEIQAC